MNAQQLIAKFKTYPLASILTLAAIVLAGWAYYRSGTLDDLRGDFDTVVAQNDQTSKNVTEGNNFKEQLDQLTAAVARYKPGLINPSANIPNQQYFYDFENTGVQIVDLGEVSSVAGKDDPSVTTFKLTASGTWDNIITFVNALQSGPHYLRFSQFDIVKAPQSRSTAGVVQPVSVSLLLEVLGQ
jgi:Tfp pilus assembly protein PilO